MGFLAGKCSPLLHSLQKIFAVVPLLFVLFTAVSKGGTCTCLIRRMQGLCGAFHNVAGQMHQLTQSVATPSSFCRQIIHQHIALFFRPSLGL